MDKHSSRAGIGLKEKVHLLYKVTASKLGEVVVSFAIENQQRVNQNEETKEYVPNEKTR